MFATLLAGALLGLGTHPDPCAKALPRGPAVPEALILSTDCGWFRLETDGTVVNLGADWLVTHKRPWQPRYPFTTRRTRAGRYIVLRDGHVVWRSAGLYPREGGMTAFGPHEFAFDSYGRRGVFLTDLNGPERLVLHGRRAYPINFTGNGELLAAGRRTITVFSHDGTVLRRVSYRPSSSYVFDEQTETLYFVTPDGMLSAANGSDVRRIRKIRAQGWIGLLGRRLLTFSGPRHVAIVRREDGALVAHASWKGARGEIDAGVDVSDDGRLFAFRLWNGRDGAQASVYVLRAGESRAHMVYHHPFTQVGCGYVASVDWEGSSLLYRSAGGGVAETALLTPDGLRTRLTPLMRALPRKSPATPGNAFWTTEFLP